LYIDGNGGVILRDLRWIFFRDKTVAVVGGGDTALEDALYLSKITRKVYLIHRRDAFRGSRILLQRVFSEPGIEIIYNAVVSAINGNDNDEQNDRQVFQ
jgi:thioredoxin reductase (NADPH)